MRNSDIDNRIRQVGGYLADILDKAESDFVKSVLNVINPKVNKNHYHYRVLDFASMPIV